MSFDIRGLPLSVVEAGVVALQEASSLREWVSAYPGTDAELLGDLAPVVAASIEAWVAYRVLADECGDNHTYEVIVANGVPLATVCSHCSSSWAVVAAPAVPAPAGSDPPPKPEPSKPGRARKPPVPKPSKALSKGSAHGRAVSKLRPDSAPEAVPKAEVEVVAGSRCEACEALIDPTQRDVRGKQLGPVNVAITRSFCGACMLRCETVDCPTPLEDYEQAVFSYMRFRIRMDKACQAAYLKGGGKAVS